MTCNCLKHFYRKGRADYHCIECERDVSLELVLLYEIGDKLEPTHRRRINPSVFETGIMSYSFVPISPITK